MNALRLLLARIDRVNASRRRSGSTGARGAALRDLADDERRNAERADKVAAAVLAYWVDERIPGIDAIVGAAYARGTLTITLRDSAAVYILDRLLRCGLEQQTRAKAPATLRRIKLRTSG